ncbi:MAG: hypothetical protein R3E31_02540 [Chloroflexota bacterium]
MSIGFDPNIVYYAVVEHLPLSQYIYDPVDGKPEREGQYRLVCLVVNSDEAARVARLLAAVSDVRYQYSVCVAEADVAVEEPQCPEASKSTKCPNT